VCVYVCEHGEILGSKRERAGRAVVGRRLAGSREREGRGERAGRTTPHPEGRSGR